MNLYGISSILTAITSLSMAVFVYVKGYRTKLARKWSIFAFATSFYGFGAFMVSHAESASEAFFWWQFAYVGIILIPFSFVYLIYEFLHIKHPLFIRFLGLWAVIFLVSDIFFKGLFINSCTLYFTDLKWVKPVYFVYPGGPLLYLFVIFYFAGLVLYGHIELVINYKKMSGLKRDQIKYFLSAAALGFAGGGTSFLPCFGLNLYPILNFTVPLYFFMVTYAILRYRLMDIKVAITRTGIFIAVYTLLLGIPFALALRLKDLFVANFGVNWWILPSGSIAVLATVATLVYIYLQRKAEEGLLKEQRRYQEILKQAGMGMTRIHSLQELLHFFVNIVIQNVHISHSAIYLYDKEGGKFVLKAGGNLKQGQPASIGRETRLIKCLEDGREPIVHEEIKRETEEDVDSGLESLEKQLELLDAAVVVPSFSEDKLLGFLILGDKLSEKTYTQEDLNAFSVLASQAALAIENALLYENIEDQVRQRTRELVEVQKQLVQAEKLATVGTLAGGVAHEINNPLAAILTNVQMLLAVDTGMDRESLEIIEEATRRCRTIVQKLMAYGRKPLEAVDFSEVDLSDVFKSVMSFIGYQLEQENVRIVADLKKDGYVVKGNPNELEQVLTNIILNGRDAIRKIKKSGDIRVTLSRNGKWVAIAVEDEGTGISRDIQRKIFDPFFTTKDVGKGLGLGLSICQSIVEKHKGTISIDSELNKGTVVTVRLPAANAADAGKGR
ncbi:MAG: ATP-binding protein [Candidatus Omnitrophica bacterium]|nr:ATP-binding protein [Candidatus Omnitrophota bacterium]